MAREEEHHFVNPKAKPGVSEVELIPPAESLFESLRAFGYSFSTAIADLVDNSLAAESSAVEIQIADDDELRVAVIDDGHGMSREELLVAMTPGSTSPLAERQQQDLGRFGLGLKTASLSQCRRLTVITRRDGTTHALTWDLDVVQQLGRWVALEPSEDADLPFADQIGDHGTVVVWETIDGPDGVELEVGSRRRAHAVNELTTGLSSHLELVFHRFLEGEKGRRKVNLAVNGRSLEPFDPFNRNNPATMHLPSEIIRYAGTDVVVQPFVLPHFKKVDTVTWARYAGPRGYLRGQGFYLYRNRRLIVDGSWLGLKKQTPITQLARIQVDIDNRLDREWRIGVRKDGAQLPLLVKDRLKELIDKIDLQSRKPFTHRGRRLSSAQRYPVWNRVQDAEAISYRVNVENPLITGIMEELTDVARRHLGQLLELVGASLPIEMIYSDFGTDGHSIGSGSVEDDTLEAGVVSMYQKLHDAGLSPDDIEAVLLAQDPYRSNQDKVKEILSLQQRKDQ